MSLVVPTRKVLNEMAISFPRSDQVGRLNRSKALNLARQLWGDRSVRQIKNGEWFISPNNAKPFAISGHGTHEASNRFCDALRKELKVREGQGKAK